MATLPKFVQAQKTTLAGSGITSTATTIILTSLTHLPVVGGATILTADIGAAGYATIEPGTDREEIVSFTTITQNASGTATLTGVTRNLKPYSPYNQYSATGYAHSGGSTFVLTNNPQVYDAVTDYTDQVAIAGVGNASTTTMGGLELGTSAEVTAGTATGGTGAALAVTPDALSASVYGTNSASVTAAVSATAGAGDASKLVKLDTSGYLDPSLSRQYVLQSYTTVPSSFGGSSTTRFDITNPSGTTFRYTYDGTGTDPLITAAAFPAGTIIDIYSPNMTAANTGVFTVTGSGTNYIEVTNASGVAENDKTFGSTFYFVKSATWTKPTGLKYAIVEMVGGGQAGNRANGSASPSVPVDGGSGGGYSRKLYLASALSSTEQYLVGIGGTAGSSQGRAGASAFKGIVALASGGTPTGGDVNLAGHRYGVASGGTTHSLSGEGGHSRFGWGGRSVPSATGGLDGIGYGAGGSGACEDRGAGNFREGGVGAQGIVYVHEFYI